MAEMELRVDDSFKNALVPVEFNYEELKLWLTDSLAKYKGRVFTDEQMPEAKQISATLNKVSKAIDDQRIAVKKIYLNPYNDFEMKCKELSAMIQEVRSEIKAQVDSFNDAKREAKMDAVRQYYEEKVPKELQEYMPFDVIADPRWANATTPIEEPKSLIDNKIGNTSRDLQLIRNFESPYEVVLLDLYKQTRDIRIVWDKQRQYEKEKEAAEKRKQAEEQKAQKSLFDTPQPKQEEPKPAAPKPSGEIRELVMVARGTKEQFIALRKAVDQIGMTMERYTK